MRFVFLIIFAVTTTLGCRAQDAFRLRTGDLLFQVNGHSSYTEAIRRVTTGIDQVEFTHVGAVSVEQGKTYVLEAVPYGVIKSPIEKFFRNSLIVDGKPVVAVGRLKARLRKNIPQAIERIQALLGKRYDFVFDPDDDDYYCSELIYATYLRADGSPIFQCAPMTFRDKATGEISPLWIEHFKRYGSEIPEGVPGTNPGDMSRSDQIRIVHRYF